MMPQEQTIFSDRSVYITNTRLVLRKGGVYPIANLAQVSLSRSPYSRFWIGPLCVGLIALVLGAILNQNSSQVTNLGSLNGQFFVEIGVVLLALDVVGVLLQRMFPLYVVVLRGTFGYARPIKGRSRQKVGQVVDALNEAISRRNASTVVNQHIDASHHSRDINIGSGAQVSGLYAFNDHSFNTLSNQTEGNLQSGTLDASRMPGQGVLPLTRPGQPVNQPATTGAGVRKIIISYSQNDQHWLERLRIHLAMLERRQMIELWDDTQIAPGMQVQRARANALRNADFALLLVSNEFLASDVIMRQELPEILQRHSQGRLTMLPLIVSPCLYGESPLAGYQPFNPDNPLSSLSTPKQDKIFVDVADKIKRAVS